MTDSPAVVRELIDKLNQFHARVESSPEQLEVQVVLSDIELLDELKAAIDHVRHCIWPYLLSAEQQSPQNGAYALQLYRMQRIREMMTRLMHGDSAENDPKRLLFVHEMQRVVSSREMEATQSKISR